MKVFQQKILRFDIDPIVYKPSVTLLKEKISLMYEADIYPKDHKYKILRLNWKIHYLDFEENEIIGLLILHNHLLEEQDLTVESLRIVISTSALNARQKLEDGISPEFFLTSEIYTIGTVALATKILTILTTLEL